MESYYETQFTWRWANEEDHSDGVIVKPLVGVNEDEISDEAVSGACGMPVRWFDGCGNSESLYIPKI